VRLSRCGGALATQHQQATAAGSSANSVRRTKRSRAGAGGGVNGEAEVGEGLWAKRI